MRTGCQCAVRPPGSVDELGQEQQLTHTQLEAPPPALFTRRPHQLQLSVLAAARFVLLFCCASACLGSRGTGAFSFLTFCLPISCDRCVSPGGGEYELFYDRTRIN